MGIFHFHPKVEIEHWSTHATIYFMHQNHTILFLEFSENGFLNSNEVCDSG
jgi:hypothetical protein